MPITLSYDLKNADVNDRSYIRSMLERFHWRRLGGSVFRYEGVLQAGDGIEYEDWLNHIVPSIMFFRSFLLSRHIELRFFTIDASGTSFIDLSDPAQIYGNTPQSSEQMQFANPTNEQSSVKLIKHFVDASIGLTRPLGQAGTEVNVN